MFNRNETINLVRQYNLVISPRFNGQGKVLMYGSYSKGYPNPWSDINVAVIVPTILDDLWLEHLWPLGKAATR